MRPILELTRQMRRVFCLFFLKYSLNVCSNCIATYFPQQVEGRSFSSWKMPETDFTFSLSTLSVASAAAFQPCSFLTKNASRVPLYTSVCLYLSVWKWRALLCKQFLSAFTSSLLLALTLTSTADFFSFCIELSLFTDFFPALLKLILR